MEFRKIEIRKYALSWAMGISETKASYPLLSFALSIFPDFVIFSYSMERDRSHPHTRAEYVLDTTLLWFRMIYSPAVSPANTDFLFSEAYFHIGSDLFHALRKSQLPAV